MKDWPGDDCHTCDCFSAEPVGHISTLSEQFEFFGRFCAKKVITRNWELVIENWSFVIYCLYAISSAAFWGNRIATAKANRKPPSEQPLAMTNGQFSIGKIEMFTLAPQGRIPDKGEMRLNLRDRQHPCRNAPA